MIKRCALNIDAHNRETDNRGTPMFPCVGYTTFVSNAMDQNIPWHWHCEVEVLVVRSGRLTFSFVGGEYQLKEGQGAFINTAVLQSATAPDGEVCEIHSLVFHPDLVAGMAEGMIEQRYVRPLLESGEVPCVYFGDSIAWHREAVQYISSAFDACQSETFGFEMVVREKLSHVWLLIVSHYQNYLSTHTAPNQDASRLKNMLSYIHTQYAQKITVSDIARAASISERECLRCFRRTTGVSPMQYVVRHRLSVAAGLLAKTDRSITDICGKCGFESPSYFSMAFKKTIEMTPKEYRNSISTSRRETV